VLRQKMISLVKKNST